ncbi:MAG TPA: hypothetical protein VFA77_09880, partial [Candidatus Eisenbacteria bacterium]|nr:hypothetical protein [Candidatus Eisenbacteria bacterium]
TSKSAVSRISKSACREGSTGVGVVMPADLEIGDTAGLETCATTERLFRSPGQGRLLRSPYEANRI